MARVSVSQMLNALVDIGRQYLDRPEAAGDATSLITRCRDLVSVLGEASGTALASEIIDGYADLPDDEKTELLVALNGEFAPDEDQIVAAARDYISNTDPSSYRTLARAIESPRQELFRRLNMAPGGTAAIVGMRERLLSKLREKPEFEGFEHDLKHLLSSWFNRGFLQFERIDWRTPAVILEKLIAYEAVHEIKGWDDLRRRLADDRRCFAFFHPALPDEPLIFVEVALTRGLAGQVQNLLNASPADTAATDQDTAVFYSISNCQEGLAGISFGNFLIKQVVDAICAELPAVTQFATLSPIPGFRRWVDDALVRETPPILSQSEIDLLQQTDWRENDLSRQHVKQPLMRLCAHYLLKVKRGELPLDPVGRFHLGNGASVERVNWAADMSQKGIRQSAGMMVNYLYEPRDIVSNHEAFVREGAIAASSPVSKLAAGRD